MAEAENEVSEETVPQPEPESNGEIGANKFLVKERFEIDYAQPLPWLDCNGAKAYRVIDRIDTKRGLFALICSNKTCPRSTILPYIKSIECRSLMKLVEFGIVTWLPEKSRNLALIYKLPYGKVFEGGKTSLDIRSSEKFKNTLINLLSAIEALKNYNITHRAIRADNIYYANAEKTEIMLGDCCASFPAFYQPSAYETIENMLSIPEGRGNGSEKNDIYAIGALMMALYLGHEIVPEMSTPELLRIKLKKGSYQALLADDHIPNQISPVLRNLLNDNVENRLNYIQAYNLLDGKTGNYSSSTATDRPKRTISFNGEKFYNARDFAIAISNAPTEAYELVKSGKLLDWIKNGLENEKLAGKIEKLLTTYPEGTTSTDIIISKICILLMPDLPLKLNNLCLFPDGAPKAIFYALRNGMETKPFYELFSAELIKLWYQEQEHMRSPANAAEFRIYINRQDIGYGLDRIMYDFDDDIPCVSSLLGDEFVNSPTRILRALDNTYSKQIVKSMPYDRNIIAYLRCKMGKKIDGILTDLATGKDYLQASAILRLYTSMQNKFGPAQLPHLSQWLASSSISIIKSYHNLKYQKFLERELLKINKNGKLHELCDILEDEEARNKDKANYTKAVSDINFLLSEKNKLINNSSKIDDEARNMAIRFTSILAIMVMLASFLFNLILWVLK